MKGIENFEANICQLVTTALKQSSDENDHHNWSFVILRQQWECNCRVS
jgi:hypothetical protein